MGDAQRRGVSKIIDIEHGLNPTANPKYDPNHPPITGGYFDLELGGSPDAPELWIKPRWSDCGREAPVPGMVCCATHQITSGQREYLSPDWDLDPETREPIRLNRVSLVGEPGTYGISMLASATISRGKTMNEIDKLRAAYAGNMALAGSSDESIKAAALAMCESLKAAASALGIDLEKAPEEAAPASEAPVAKKASEDAPPAEPAKVVPAAGAAEPPADPSKEKPLTASALNRILAERDERTAMMADPRVSKEMANVIASADLSTARNIVKALPALPAPQGTNGQTQPVNHTASAAKVEVPLNAVEAHIVDGYRRALGLTAENVTAARKMMDADPDGELGIAVSLSKLVDKHKARRNPAANAMKFGI
jgi:hypothetical protein